MSADPQEATEPARRGGRELRAGERRSLAVLAVPTLGLALSIAAVSTCVPVLARHLVRSNIVIGLLVGAEGLAAIILPVLVGTWSDQLRTRLGGRLPFLIAATPIVAVALIGIGLASSLPEIAVAVVVFFAAYFVAYEPYRALYPDLVDDKVAGRAQSAQAIARGTGTVSRSPVRPVAHYRADRALPGRRDSVGHLRRELYFLLLRRRGVPDQDRQQSGTAREAIARIRTLLAEHPPLRAFLAANALWELALAAIKTFVVLWLAVGLGYSLSQTSAIIGAVALVILVAAALSGKLADRYGRVRILPVALWVYGIGLIIPLLSTTPLLIVPSIPLIAFGGGVTMTLPYALLMPMMPPEQYGSVTGLYSISRGVGILLGPLLAGIAVQLGSEPLSSTHGYAAMWLIASVAILASLSLLARVGTDRLVSDKDG